MKIIDVHSHWGTKRGYPLQTPAEREQQKATWNSQVNYHSEAEMAQYFRDSSVQTILDFGFSKFLPMEDSRAARLRLRDRGRASRRHPRTLDPHRSALG